MPTGIMLEKKTVAEYERQGYMVHRTKNSPPVFSHGRWISSSNNDILGLFDGLSIAKDHLAVLWQCTTLTHVSHRRNKIDAGLQFQPCNVFVDVWGWEKVKGRWVARVWRRIEPGVWKEIEEGMQ